MLHTNNNQTQFHSVTNEIIIKRQLKKRSFLELYGLLHDPERKSIPLEDMKPASIVTSSPSSP